MGARPSSFKGVGTTEPTDMEAAATAAAVERIWSKEQQTIFGWFQDLPVQDPAFPFGGMNPGLPTRREQTQHAVVRARAGTGKTTTIVEGVRRMPEDFVLVAAFNARIAAELTARLDGVPNAEAKTLHSLGYAMVRRQWPRMPVCQPKELRSEWLTDAALAAHEQTAGEKVPRVIHRLITQLHTKGREMHPLDYDEDALTKLAFRFDLAPAEHWGDYDVEFVVLHALAAMHTAATVAPSYAVGIDFADMLCLPLMWNLTARDYQAGVVDEAQDMTVAQLELFRRSVSGRICVVGDDKQCQPAGTMVRSSAEGNVPIETLKVGDTIEAFDRHGQVFIKSGRVNQIARRLYNGELVNVAAAGCVTKCTPSHKWLVRWSSKFERTWITYLMRQGGRFRVGQCQLFRHGCRNFGLSERARVEHADAAWILTTHESLEHALAYEQVVSARYGLPEMVFSPPSNIRYFTQEVINTVYMSLECDGLYEKAVRCLEEHDRDIRYPIYETAEYGRRGRTTLFETQACNLLSGHMSVAIAPDVISGHGKKDRHQVTWMPIAVWREDFNGLVYSLDVDRYHKYVADGLVTCNSIYGFRGADSNSINRLKSELQAVEFPLHTTYRCGQRIVAEAQRLVPDIVAADSNPEGIVRETSYAQLLEGVRPGDVVLSRLNAPLVSLALRLWRNSVRARVAGRGEIDTQVRKVLDRLKLRPETPIETVVMRIDEWRRKRVAVLSAYRQFDLIATTEDMADVLCAMCEDVENYAQLLQRIDRLFTDSPDQSEVLCSSIHKAKGLEWERVWLLRDTLYTRGDSPEERNIEYVAVTRAKRELVFVTALPTPRRDSPVLTGEDTPF